MVRVPFDGFELGPPPQPAITSTRGAAQAKSERRSRVISTIQGCCQLYVPGVSASPGEAPVCVSRKSYGRERRTGTKHQIDGEVARQGAVDRREATCQIFRSVARRVSVTTLRCRGDELCPFDSRL